MQILITAYINSSYTDAISCSPGSNVPSIFFNRQNNRVFNSLFIDFIFKFNFYKADKEHHLILCNSLFYLQGWYY